MRVFVSILASAFLLAGASLPAAAQGKRQPPPAEKADAGARERAEQSKAADAEHRRTMQRIPDSNEKPDPWKNIRGK